MKSIAKIKQTKYIIFVMATVKQLNFISILVAALAKKLDMQVEALEKKILERYGVQRFAELDTAGASDLIDELQTFVNLPEEARKVYLQEAIESTGTQKTLTETVQAAVAQMEKQQVENEAEIVRCEECGFTTRLFGNKRYWLCLNCGYVPVNRLGK